MEVREPATVKRLTVEEMNEFETMGKLPPRIDPNNRISRGEIPLDLLVTLAVLLDRHIARTERVISQGQSVPPADSSDLREQLIRNRHMELLLGPAEEERREILHKPLSQTELTDLQLGKVPAIVRSYFQDYNELPPQALKPITEAIIDTTTERDGQMLPAFDELYRHSPELHPLVDRPIQEALQLKGIIDSNSSDHWQEASEKFRGSEAHLLEVAEFIQTEGLKESHPDKWELLTQLLNNDGYLSNEEIVSALYKEDSTRNDFINHVKSSSPHRSDEDHSLVADYLESIHKGLKQHPQLMAAGPAASHDLITVIEQAENPSASLPTMAKRLENAELTGLVAQDLKHKEQESQSQNSISKSVRNLANLAELQFFKGGFLANFINNYHIMQKAFNVVYNTDPNQKEQTQTAERLRNRFIPKEQQQKDRPSIVKRFTDKLIENLNNENSLTQSVSSSMGPGWAGTLVKKLEDFLQPVKDYGPGVEFDPQLRQSQVIKPSNQAVNELSSEQQLRWDQLEKSLKKLQIDTRSLTGTDRHNLLEKGITDRAIPFILTTHQGVLVPSTGKLLVIEKPGKAPEINIVPLRFRNPLPVPNKLNLRVDQELQLLKTGRLNEPVLMEKKGTKQPYLISFDTQKKQIQMLPVDKVVIPEKIGTINLTQKQRYMLQQGKQLQVRFDQDNQKAAVVHLHYNVARKGVEITKIAGSKQAIAPNKPEKQALAPQNKIPKNNKLTQKTLSATSVVTKNGSSRITENQTGTVQRVSETVKQKTSKPQSKQGRTTKRKM